MPEGGIFPHAFGTNADFGTCWVCRKPGTKHYWHEFDTGIHARCAVKMKADSLVTPDPEADLLRQMALDFDLEDQ